MGKSVFSGVMLVGCLASLAFGAGAEELVLNPKFETVEAGKLPEGWIVWGPVWE